MPPSVGTRGSENVIYDESQETEYIRDTQLATNKKMRLPFSREYKKELLAEALNINPLFKTIQNTLKNSDKALMTSAMFRDIVMEEYLLIDGDPESPAVVDGSPRIPFIDIAILNKIVYIAKEVNIDSLPDGVVLTPDGHINRLASAVQQSEIAGVPVEQVLLNEKDVVSEFFHTIDNSNSPSALQTYISALDYSSIFNGSEYSSDYIKNIMDSFDENSNAYYNDTVIQSYKTEEDKSRLGTAGVFGNEIEAKIYDVICKLEILKRNEEKKDRYLIVKNIGRYEDLLNQYANLPEGARFKFLIEQRGGFNSEGFKKFIEDFNHDYNRSLVTNNIKRDLERHNERINIQYGKGINKTTEEKDEDSKNILRLFCGVVSREDSIRLSSLKFLENYTISGINLGTLLKEKGENAVQEILKNSYEQISGKELDPENGYSQAFKDVGCLSLKDMSHNIQRVKRIKDSVRKAGGVIIPNQQSEKEIYLTTSTIIKTTHDVSHEIERYQNQNLGIDIQQKEIGKYIDSFDLSEGSRDAYDVQRLLLELYKRDFEKCHNGRKPTEEEYCSPTVLHGNGEYIKTLTYVMNNYPKVLKGLIVPVEGVENPNNKITPEHFVFAPDAKEKIEHNYKYAGNKRVSSMVNRVLYASKEGYNKDQKKIDLRKEYMYRLSAFALYEKKDVILKGGVVGERINKYSVTPENIEQRKAELGALMMKMPPELLISDQLRKFEKGLVPLLDSEGNPVLDDYKKPMYDEVDLSITKELVEPRINEAMKEVNKGIQERRRINKNGEIVFDSQYKEPNVFQRLLIRGNGLRSSFNILMQRRIKENMDVKDMVVYQKNIFTRITDLFKTPLENAQEQRIVHNRVLQTYKQNEAFSEEQKGKIEEQQRIFETVGEVSQEVVDAMISDSESFYAKPIVSFSEETIANAIKTDTKLQLTPEGIEAALKKLEQLKQEGKLEYIKSISAVGDEVTFKDAGLKSILTEEEEKDPNREKELTPLEKWIKIIREDTTIDDEEKERLIAKKIARENMYKKAEEEYNAKTGTTREQRIASYRDSLISDEQANEILDKFYKENPDRIPDEEKTFFGEDKTKESAQEVTVRAQENIVQKEEMAEKQEEAVQKQEEAVQKQEENVEKAEEVASKQEEVIQKQDGIMEETIEGLMDNQIDPAEPKEQLVDDTKIYVKQPKELLIKKPEGVVNELLSGVIPDTPKVNDVEEKPSLDQDVKDPNSTQVKETKDLNGAQLQEEPVSKESTNKSNDTKKPQDKLSEQKSSFEASLKVDNVGDKLEKKALDQMHNKTVDSLKVTVSVGNNQEQENDQEEK